MKVVDSLKVPSKSSKVSRPFDKNLLIHPLIAFIVTVFIYSVLLFINQVTPFGDKHLLESDLKAQFAPYLILLKNHLKEIDFSSFGSSFTYTNVITGGKNFMATFGYYMGSPLNLLIFLFNDYQLDLAISFIVGLKIALASAFMTIYLKHRAPKKDSIWPLIFGITYGFTSYIIAFMFVIIWLDGYALLPLILYFVENFINERKKTGLVVTLIWLFVSNLYVSYMVGLFSFFYLVARLIHKVVIDKDLKAKAATNIAFKFVITAIICILTIGAFLIPVALNILQNRDSLIDTYKTDAVTFKGIEMINQLLLGSVGDFNSKLGDNLPFIFVSLFVVILSFIFFISKVFEKKEKIYYCVILILAYLSFNITFIDYAWQGFDKPNWFCHRYSFIFYPVFYMISLKVIEKIKEIKVKEILVSSISFLAIIIIAQSFGDLGLSGTNFIANIAFVIVYTLLLLAMKKEKWHEQLKNMQKLSKYILIIVLVFECSGINSALLGNISSYLVGGSSFKYESEANLIIDSVKALDSVSSNRMAMEESFISSNIEIDASDESALLGNYNSVNIFDSNSNKAFARFMKQLGNETDFCYAITEYSYTSEPVNAFFSMPFVMMNELSYSGKVVNALAAGNSQLYTYYVGEVLPMGFAVDKNALSFDFYQLEKKEFNKDYFKLQNAWYKSMFPDAFTEDFYHSYRVIRDTDITLHNGAYFPMDVVDVAIPGLSSVDPSSFDNSTKAFQKRNAIMRTSDSIPVCLEINYVVKDSGEQYFAAVADRLLDEMSIIVNGKEAIFVEPDSYYSRVIRLGYFNEGDTIEVLVKSNQNIFSYQDFYFASIDKDVFDNQLSNVNKDKVVTDRYENGHLEFTTNLEDNDILLTSVPFENGWTCFVDGVETEIIPYQNTFLSVNPGPGQHKVEFRFLAPGAKAGLVVSGVGIISLILLYVVDNKKKK